MYTFLLPLSPNLQKKIWLCIFSTPYSLVTIDKELLEIAAVDHLREGVELSVIHANTHEFQHIGMIQLLEQLHLSQHVLALRPILAPLQHQDLVE